MNWLAASRWSAEMPLSLLATMLTVVLTAAPVLGVAAGCTIEDATCYVDDTTGGQLRIVAKVDPTDGTRISFVVADAAE